MSFLEGLEIPNPFRYTNSCHVSPFKSTNNSTMKHQRENIQTSNLMDGRQSTPNNSTIKWDSSRIPLPTTKSTNNQQFKLAVWCKCLFFHPPYLRRGLS